VTTAVRLLLGAVLVLLPPGRAVSARAGAASAPSVPAQAAAPVGMETVRVGVLRNGTYEVVSVPMEVYVARVLAGEAAPASPPASLEALAIAIRTYTITNRGRHASEGFDLCDQTHCQVMRTAYAATERAALATTEQVLQFQGAPATVFYSASCGGRSEKPSNVWPGADDPAYLSIHDDDGCGGFPVWSADLADSDLQRALVAGGFRGSLRNVRVLARNESGRVARLELDGMTPREISGQDLRMVVGRTLGFQHIQSTQFDLRRSGASSHFSGRGSGHGVGLCVIGSMKLAAAGQTAATILARYFPGTRIGPYGARLTAAPPESPTIGAPPVRDARAVPPALAAPAAVPPAGAGRTVSADPSLPSDIVVTLPPPFESGEHNALVVLAARERVAMAAALGVPAQSLRVRVHPSSDAYERASGRPWFTLSALKDGEIELVPLWLLRERGMLERVIRREVVHQLADPVLPGKPAWIREGAAVYFADPEAQSSARVVCPQDRDLLQPVSPGALGDAFARARACFERQLTGGRDWRRVH